MPKYCQYDDDDNDHNFDDDDIRRDNDHSDRVEQEEIFCTPVEVHYAAA